MLQRMGSSWDVAKESHNFQGAWSFEKKRKDLVKLLSICCISYMKVEKEPGFKEVGG